MKNRHVLFWEARSEKQARKTQPCARSCMYAYLEKLNSSSIRRILETAKFQFGHLDLRRMFTQST